MVDHPKLSIEAQIGDHMTRVLANDGFQHEIKWVQEVDRSSLTGTEGTVCRTYLPEYAMEQSDRPRISIILFSSKQDRAFRNIWLEDYMIDVVVHQRINDPSTTKHTTPENVRAREQLWRQKVTEYGDIVTKLAEQVRMAFERWRDSGAVYLAPGSDVPNCAVFLNAQRDATFQQSLVNEKHIVFAIVRTLWRTYRPVAEE